MRDVFLSMQFPPVDEIVANSKTGKNDHRRPSPIRRDFLFRLSHYS